MDLNCIINVVYAKGTYNWTGTHWDCGHQWHNQLEDYPVVHDDSTAQCYLLYHRFKVGCPLHKLSRADLTNQNP